MKKIRRCFIVVLLGYAFQAGAWGPICHYLIAKEVASQMSGLPAGIENYANLPDYAENKRFDFDLWPTYLGLENTTEFCWSHGVISETVHNLGAIDIHEVCTDGRRPGFVMRELLINKVRAFRYTDPVEKLAAMNTVNGFIAHNSADREVHFDYFSKGTDQLWIVHHGLKETYAEYDRLMRSAFGGNPSLMFDINGNINRSAFAAGTMLDVQDTVAGIPFIGTTGAEIEATARLMRLGQMVYRKNRRVWHTNDEDKYKVQDLSEIIAMLNDRKVKQNLLDGVNYWSRYQWATWKTEIPYSPDLPLIDTKDENGYVTEGSVPENLQDEYMQLVAWYSWSHNNRASGDPEYWDDGEINIHFNTAIQKVMNTPQLGSAADLEPQG